MYQLYKIETPIPCNILGCENTDATLVVRTDDGNGDYAVCPECVETMSDMNDTNADFFAQEPRAARQIHQGECVECGRFSSQLTENGYCEGCVMQAAIDAQERWK